MVPVLNCRACGGLTSGARFRYICERLICDHCGAENPDTRVSHVQTRDIFIRFSTADGCSVQAKDLNLARLAHACPSPARRSCARYWPTWAPCPWRSKSSTAPTRAAAKATCASLSIPAARTCCACDEHPPATTMRSAHSPPRSDVVASNRSAGSCRRA